MLTRLTRFWALDNINLTPVEEESNTQPTSACAPQTSSTLPTTAIATTTDSGVAVTQAPSSSDSARSMLYVYVIAGVVIFIIFAIVLLVRRQSKTVLPASQHTVSMVLNPTYAPNSSASPDNYGYTHLTSRSNTAHSRRQTTAGQSGSAAGTQDYNALQRSRAETQDSYNALQRTSTATSLSLQQGYNSLSRGGAHPGGRATLGQAREAYDQPNPPREAYDQPNPPREAYDQPNPPQTGGMAEMSASYVAAAFRTAPSGPAVGSATLRRQAGLTIDEQPLWLTELDREAAVAVVLAAEQIGAFVCGHRRGRKHGQ